MKNRKKLSFRSKNILVVMTILCVALLLFAYTARLPLDSVQSVAGYAVVPFQKGINSIGNWLYNQGRGFEDIRALQQENEELQQKVDTLTEQNNLLLQDQDKLERFESLYSLDMDYAEYDKVAASVISKNPGNWYNTFTIDKGTKDGIEVDMNVIAGGGLCGIVTEAGPDWAAVRTIIDDASNVSAMVSSTLDNCLVAGDLTLIEDGKLNFIQLSDTEDLVSVGDKIVTSNISNKFLKGILIGYISEINYDSNNLTKYGYLIPVVDFRHLQEVLVIKELKKTGEKK